MRLATLVFDPCLKTRYLKPTASVSGCRRGVHGCAGAEHLKGLILAYAGFGFGSLV